MFAQNTITLAGKIYDPDRSKFYDKKAGIIICTWQQLF